jgi:hypothetical protein
MRKNFEVEFGNSIKKMKSKRFAVSLDLRRKDNFKIFETITIREF